MAWTRYDSQLPNIYYDSSTLRSRTPGAAPNNQPLRFDLFAEDWEAGVRLALDNLYKNAPFRTSRVVIDGVVSTGEPVLIVPNNQGPHSETQPVNFSNPNPQVPPYQAASVYGLTELDPNGNPLPGNPVGAGTGSGVRIRFTPQDYLGIVAQPAGPPDEALIHELVHALRISNGIVRPVAVPVKFGLTYDNVEELLTVTVANIYRSEQISRPHLRADHHGHRPLQQPFTDPETFYLTYDQELNGILDWMPILFSQVALVACRFNPVRACLKHKLGIQKDSDVVDLGLRP